MEPAITPPAGTRAFRLTPYFLAAVLLLPSLWWIASDSSVWSYDPAWYGEVSTDLWFSFTHDPVRWFKIMFRAFAVKAPGIAWFGQFFVPLGQITGSIEFGLLFSVLLTQLATLVLIFKMARELWPDRGALHFLAPVIVVSTPLFVGMTHQYFVEPLQLFAVTYFYWLAVRSDSLAHQKIKAHLAIAVSLAMLAKVSSPMYCAGPGAIAIYNFFFRKSASEPQTGVEHRKTKRLLIFGIVLSLCALGWYVKNFVHLVRFLKSASSGAAALDYGRAMPLPAKLVFWLHAVQQSFFLPKILWLIGLVLLLVGGTKVFRIRKIFSEFRFGRVHLIVLAALAHFLAVLLILSLNINEETRYLLPVLPSVLIIFLWVISSVRWRWLASLLLLFFLSQWGFVQWHALNFSRSSQEQHLQRITALKISPWLFSCQRDGQRKNEIHRLAQSTANEKLPKQINICGVELPWLNEYTLSFFAAQERLKCGFRANFASLGYAEKNANKAWENLHSIDPAYFISINESLQPKPPDFVNQVSLPILQRIRADNTFVAERFESSFGILVFRNSDKKLP